MIYTVTLNPSIDYIVHVEDFKLGQVNRMTKELKFPGGKGINVSRILKRLNRPTTALGFLGGFTGTYVDAFLAKEGVRSHFTEVNGDTRINIKLKSTNESEINGLGPQISDSEIKNFLKTFETITADDIVVLAGNRPKSLPEDFYIQLIHLIQSKKAQFIIDTTGPDLLSALPNRPLLIKPNKEELADLYQTTITDFSSLIYYGKKLLKDGPEHVIISMAGDGALLFTETGLYQAAPIKRPLKNSVGAGDSMIAGFVGNYSVSQDSLEAFRWGVACGSATAFSDDLASKDFILELLSEVVITKIEEEK